VQSIADTFWRLRRIPILETAIFAKGRIEFAELFNEQDLAARPHLIDAHTFITYEKQIRNLQLQEARLARRREKEIAELRKLQAERVQSKTGTGEHSAPFAESAACPRFAEPERTGRCAAQQHLLATLVPVVRDQANGFVFSTPEIEHDAAPERQP
jgi:hypothetical protein